MKRAQFFLITALAFVLLLSPFALQQITETRQRASEVDSALIMPDNYLMISGYVYVDENRNGERDLRERGYQGADISVTVSRSRPKATPPRPTSNPVTTVYPVTVAPTYVLDYSTLSKESTVMPLFRTDNHGYFKYKVAASTVPDANVFTVKLLAPTNFIITTKNPITFERLHNRARRIVEFGIARDPNITPTPISMASCTAELSGLQEVPQTKSQSKAYLKMVSSNVITSPFNLSITSSNFDLGQVTAAHIHSPAVRGVNAPATVTMYTNTTFAPAPFTNPYETQVTVPPTVLDAMKKGLAYINIHTAAYPNGEIRGQLQCAGGDPKPSCIPMPKECQFPTTRPDGSLVACTPPPGGWCPTTTPIPTCIPRPRCLDTEPRCLMPEPIGGWCPITPTPQICGQAFTWGRNTETHTCQLFPTTCLPEGWVADRSCALTPTPKTTGVACTADAKQCPDGSWVGRVPPSCEFAACPSIAY